MQEAKVGILKNKTNMGAFRDRRTEQFLKIHYKDCASGSKKLKVPPGLQKGDRILPDGTVLKAVATENIAK